MDEQFLPPPQMDPESVKKLTAIAEKYGQKLYPLTTWIGWARRNSRQDDDLAG